MESAASLFSEQVEKLKTSCASTDWIIENCRYTIAQVKSALSADSLKTVAYRVKDTVPYDTAKECAVVVGGRLKDALRALRGIKKEPELQCKPVAPAATSCRSCAFGIFVAAGATAAVAVYGYNYKKKNDEEEK